MSKFFTSFLCFFIAFLNLNNVYGQGQGTANNIEVAQVSSPIANFNYQLNDSVELVIRIRNVGPNALIAGDQFKITYSIANSDSTYSRDTLIQVGVPMAVGNILQYTLLEKIVLDNASNFSVCADVKGTIVYPDNTNKFPSSCSAFIVGLEKTKPSVESIYFANGRLNFKINHGSELKAYIFDLTGRQLAEKNIQPHQRQSIDLVNPSKGFYFLKLIDKTGNSAITKFVIN